MIMSDLAVAADEERASPARRRLAELLAARRSAVAEAEEAGRVLARLRTAEGAVAEAEAELAALDQWVRDGVRDWAAAGAEGEAPRAPDGRRQELIERLAEAAALAKAARAAAPELEQPARDAQAKVAALERQIEDALTDALADELAPHLKELEAACERAWSLKAIVAALPEYLRRLANQRRQRPGDAFSQGLFGRAERLEKFIAASAIHQSGLTGAQLTDAVAAWAERAAELQR